MQLKKLKSKILSASDSIKMHSNTLSALRLRSSLSLNAILFSKAYYASENCHHQDLNLRPTDPQGGRPTLSTQPPRLNSAMNSISLISY